MVFVATPTRLHPAWKQMMSREGRQYTAGQYCWRNLVLNELCSRAFLDVFQNRAENLGKAKQIIVVPRSRSSLHDAEMNHERLSK